MLFRAATLPGIADGSVTVAFRRWKRPMAKVGGRVHTRVGMIEIDAVDALPSDAAIDPADAVLAGLETPAGVVADLRDPEPDRQLYRVAFHFLGDDPRALLRDADDLSADDIADLRSRLARFDRDADAPWVVRVIDEIAAHPGEVSTALAERLGIERFELKRRIRKLKGLGLTESLQVGYRLAPRGTAIRRELDD
ncbi:MAG: hypothetical protein Q7T55_10180 [Solirubrobacteraceae bacterium]|nr:hypothetical protein [Solirubrobacteraceae bacterium]